MRAKLIACAMLLMLPLFFQSRPAAQDATFDLTEKLELGTVRKHTRAYVQTTSWTTAADTDFRSTTKWRIDSQSSGEEWVAGMEGGRVTEAWRSMGAVTRKRTDTHDFGNGPVDTTLDEYDLRQNYTIPFKVDAKGVRTSMIDKPTLFENSHVLLFARDRDPVGLPGKRVTEGATWDIAETALPLPAEILPEAVTKSFKATGELVEFTTNNNTKVAVISIAGSRTATIHERNAFDNSVARELAISTTFTGTGHFAYETGRMVAFTWRGSLTANGKEHGQVVAGTAAFEETWNFGYGSLVARAKDTTAQPAIKETVMSPHTAIDPAHVVIARKAPDGARLQVYDPAERKIIKTLIEVPGMTNISQIAISPDRKRVAFTSNSNNLISLAEANAFVYELETGKINQITPHWASGEGLAQPIKPEKTCTLKGRIVWLDDDPKQRRDRHDAYNGIVRIDQTACAVVVKFDGTFELPNVPSGVPLLMQIAGRVPLNYADGKTRGGSFLASYMGTTTAELTFNEGVVDLGDVRLQAYHTVGAFASPTWLGNDKLLVQQSGWTRAVEVGYATRSWTEIELTKEMTYMTGGLSASRDGRVAFAHDSGGVGGFGGVRFVGKDYKQIWHLKEHAGSISYSTEGAWLPLETGWVCTASRAGHIGDLRFGAPALFFANPKGQGHGIAGSWPQLSGYTMDSVAADEAGNTGYFVLRFVDAKMVATSDLWAWDATTDSLQQLTGFGDVVAVGGFGR